MRQVILVLVCCRNVGVMQVNLGQLVDVLAPSPERCIEELRQLLPRLAADAYSTFITRCVALLRMGFSVQLGGKQCVDCNSIA